MVISYNISSKLMDVFIGKKIELILGCMLILFN